jgi:hypothetical protein
LEEDWKKKSLPGRPQDKPERYALPLHGPYDSLQRPKILNGIRIGGERIEKPESWSGTREKKVANAEKTSCQLAISLKKWEIWPE